MEELHSEFLENLMPGIEVIIGRNGKHYFNSLLTDFDEKYMMKWFTRGDFASDMTKVQLLQKSKEIYLHLSFTNCLANYLFTGKRPITVGEYNLTLSKRKST